MTELEVVLAYHARTKHHPKRFARSVGYLDWASQPDPFRTFEGAPRIDLTVTPTDDGPWYDDVTGGCLPEAPTLDHGVLSRLFRDALGLSAWKEHGASRWSLRVNPSSGNLHPTEAYIITPPIPDVYDEAGVHHYQPEAHALETRRTLDAAVWSALSQRLPHEAVMIALTSIHWREAWKYGERAFRYCQHDVGHAIAAVSLSAAAVGRRALLLPSVDDAALDLLVGASAQSGIESETGACLLALVPATTPLDTRVLDFDLGPTVEALAAAPCHGEPNQLSARHHRWPVIGEVSRASRKQRRPPPGLWELPRPKSIPAPARRSRLRTLVHQRRSAVAMDGETGLERAAFGRMLSATLWRTAPPLEALPWTPRIHLALFVHRVNGLEPGLYLLVRDPAREAALRSACDTSFAWEPVGVGDLPLFRLSSADCRRLAGALSCEQYSIASESAFACAMVADYHEALDIHGPSFYRALYWEAGLVGQVLYLEAEAAAVRATGIGCYFDDATHEVLGLTDDRFQVLYHFTVGGAVDDARLRTRPPYAHLVR
jgi:SagB-type dehydrogenase family enzyme